ncbi:MAG: ZIP family metal transporter [Candidatus Pacearchaeota archaeon]|nr:ZIP family metal transporter [Candidatus Pacearchaeota archaeon]
MEIIVAIILSTFLISLIAFIGVITLLLKGKSFEKILLILVALSAGALIGGAFFHLIPESIENSSKSLYLVVFGFASFFFIEKILHWHHCHNNHCKIHSFAYMSLIAEGIHNFIDGLIIAASFLTNISLGIATTIAVAIHEIPQEIGDFGILVYGGFKKTKALIINFIVALFAVLGGITGFYLFNFVSQLTLLLLPFAAGSFIYVAASDLIPEIKKEYSLSKSLLTFLIFILGISIMFFLKHFTH